jgi:hypothetical protein
MIENIWSKRSQLRGTLTVRGLKNCRTLGILLIVVTTIDCTLLVQSSKPTKTSNGDLQEVLVRNTLMLKSVRNSE